MLHRLLRDFEWDTVAATVLASAPPASGGAGRASVGEATH
jgi:hypothetical protein